MSSLNLLTLEEYRNLGFIKTELPQKLCYVCLALYK